MGSPTGQLELVSNDRYLLHQSENSSDLYQEKLLKENQSQAGMETVEPNSYVHLSLFTHTIEGRNLTVSWFFLSL